MIILGICYENINGRLVRPDWVGIAEPKVRLDSIPDSFWNSLGRPRGLPNIWVFRSSNVLVDKVSFLSEQIIIVDAVWHNSKFSIGFVHSHYLHSSCCHRSRFFGIAPNEIQPRSRLV